MGFSEVKTRWVKFAENSKIGAELRSQWDSITRQIKALRSTLAHESQTIESTIEIHPVFLESSDEFGFYIPSKLQKVITDQFQALIKKLLHSRAKKMALDDPRAMSFFSICGCKCASQLLRTMPLGELQLSPQEWLESTALYYGVPSPMCLTVVNLPINNNANCPQRNMDAYGYNIKTATGIKGDEVRTMHDSVVTHLTNFLDNAKIKYKGGIRNTCKNMFTHCISQDIDDEEKIRIIQGIIPDIVVNGKDIRPMEDNYSNRYRGVDTLIDVKTLAPGESYSATNLSRVHLTAATKRQNKVSLDYYKHANSIDQLYNGTPIGTQGPVHKELTTFGIQGRVMGAVIGAYGEISPDITELLQLIASEQATNLLSCLKMPFAQAKNIFFQKMIRTICLLNFRGWARVLIGRCQTSVGVPRERFAAQGDLFDRSMDREISESYKYVDENI